MRKLLFLAVALSGLMALSSCSMNSDDNGGSKKEIPNLTAIKNFANYKAIAAGNFTSNSNNRAIVVGNEEGTKLLGQLPDDTFETVSFSSDDSDSTEQDWNLSTFNATENYTMLGFTQDNVDTIKDTLSNADVNYLLDKTTGKLYLLSNIDFSSSGIENGSILVFNATINDVAGLYQAVIENNNMIITLIAPLTTVAFEIKTASTDKYGNVATREDTSNRYLLNTQNQISLFSGFHLNIDNMFYNDDCSKYLNSSGVIVDNSDPSIEPIFIKDVNGFESIKLENNKIYLLNTSGSSKIVTVNSNSYTVDNFTLPQIYCYPENGASIRWRYLLKDYVIFLTEDKKLYSINNETSEINLLYDLSDCFSVGDLSIKYLSRKEVIPFANRYSDLEIYAYNTANRYLELKVVTSNFSAKTLNIYNDLTVTEELKTVDKVVQVISPIN